MDEEDFVLTYLRLLFLCFGITNMQNRNSTAVIAGTIVNIIFISGDLVFSNPFRQSLNIQDQGKLSELYCHFHHRTFEARKFNALKYYPAKEVRFFEIKTEARTIIDRVSLLSKQACLFSLVDRDSGELQLNSPLI